jgi:uncharacterized membrane protein
MDEDLLVFLIIIGAVVVIVFYSLLSNKFAEIAEMKGHSHKDYFWICFFLTVIGLGIIGWLMVIALPDRGSTIERHIDNSGKSDIKQYEASESDELPDL